MYMNLNEFLENNIPGYKLLDVLYNNDDLIVDYYDVDAEDLPKNNSPSDLILDKETVVKAIEAKKMKMSEFDKILNKYGWYMSKVKDDYIHILKLNNMDNGYYDDEDKVIHGLYLHISPVKPSIILNQGLKALASTDDELDKSNTMKRGIIYPNKRVYLWKLEDICSIKKNDENIGKALGRSLRTLFDDINARHYGNYVYIAHLPAGVRTHFDNEYGEFQPARYIIQNVPPSYLKFAGTVEQISTIIEYSEFTRLREIFGV